MKQATEPRGTTKPAQKKPARKQLATKPATPIKVRGGAGLAEGVAQLALSAESFFRPLTGWPRRPRGHR